MSERVGPRPGKVDRLRRVGPLPDHQTVTLPVPPSTNKHLLMAVDGETGKTRMFNTRDHRRYKAAARSVMGRLRPYPKDVPVTVEMVWWQTEQSEGDLDNRVKAVLDALKGYAYIDDQQVRRLVVDVDRARGLVGWLSVVIRARRSWYRSKEEAAEGYRASE